ncbi:MAG TPA: methionine--tRNA ligase [Bacteroidota bacterium]|nr:methionine--tRNA ligase [Bacteroidota bacterium]
MNSPQRILVTAALPYANGPIHLGHLAGAYLPADIYVRYQRLRKRDVLFICGSDEHGVAITLSAEKEHASAQSIVDRYHALNKEAFAHFGVSFDNYSRTSLPLHHQTALTFLLSFYRGGILREKQEKQFFDQKAGMFLPDRYVSGTCPVCGNPDARGDQCERCGTFLDPMQLKNPRSSISGETPVVRETTHLYFPLGVYQSRLEAYIREANEREPWKENVLQYCRGWFKEGLQDRAVTRDLDWGVKIPIPGYENKVIYVWFDAVLGYVSSTIEWAERAGRPDAWRQYWLHPDTKYVAFIGKDNVVFHTIVFPAMLMAWNDQNQAEQYILPANVPANEFLNFEGQKFSKSRGWGIDVQDFLARYPADPLRYYLAVNLPEYRDSDFTWRDFQAKNNNELADILGNFVNRTLAFAVRTFENTVPKRGVLEAIDREIIGLLEATPSKVAALWERYRFRDGLMEAMNLARAANKYFNDSEPWKTAKADPVRCATAINISIQLARALAILMSPVIPGSCQKIWRMLGLEGDVSSQRWESAGEMPISEGERLGKAEILFTKIEDEVIEKELQTLGQPPAAGVPASERPQISLEDFKKIDLRVAKVLSCEKIPKSEKLLKLQLEVGKEQRQVLAGIAQHYQPADLVGKLVVVVFNLQVAKLMGQESQGMLLAASDETGRLVFVSPSAEIQSGAVIR